MLVYTFDKKNKQYCTGLIHLWPTHSHIYIYICNVYVKYFAYNLHYMYMCIYINIIDMHMGDVYNMYIGTVHLYYFQMCHKIRKTNQF